MYKHAIGALAGATVLLVGASTALASAAPPTPFVSKNPVLTVITNTGTPAGTPGGLECTTGKWAKAGNRTYTIKVVRDSSKVVAKFTGVAKGAKVAYDIQEGDAALVAAGQDDGSDLGRTLKCVVSPTGYPNQRGFTSAIVVQPGGNTGTGGGGTTTPLELGAPVKTTGTDVTATGLAGEATGAQTNWELRCNEGSWSPAAPSGDASRNSWTYGWTRNGSPVLDGSGAPITTKQLQLSAADAGADIGCSVVQTRNGYASGAVQSSNTMRVAGTQPPAGGGGTSTVGAPFLTGANPSITKSGATATVVGAGDHLVCLTGGWSAPTGYTLLPVNFSFEWVLNSTEVFDNPLSQEQFAVPADLDAGDKITCLVTARSQSGDGTIVVSSPVTTNPVELG